MSKIVPIVEGDGEVTAVPALLRKILQDRLRYDIEVATAKNANGRGNLTKEGGLEKFVKYAWKESDCGAVLVLIDAENECPTDVAREFSARLEDMGVLRPVAIVVANRTYEAWILASIETMAGQLDLPSPLLPPQLPEEVTSPKTWINNHFPRGRRYKETKDQEAMTHRMNLDLAQRCRSFRRLLHAVDEAVEAIDTGNCRVTPSP